LGLITRCPAGFIETADMMINNYNFDKFEAGHLTRLGIVEDNRHHQEFIQELQTTSQQVCQNASFEDIASVVGPSNPGNPWAIINRPRNILRKPQ
jgi:hypothetical protein